MLPRYKISNIFIADSLLLGRLYALIYTCDKYSFVEILSKRNIIDSLAFNVEYVGRLSVHSSNKNLS